MDGRNRFIIMERLDESSWLMDQWIIKGRQTLKEERGEFEEMRKKNDLRGLAKPDVVTET